MILSVKHPNTGFPERLRPRTERRTVVGTCGGPENRKVGATRLVETPNLPVTLAIALLPSKADALMRFIGEKL